MSNYSRLAQKIGFTTLAAGTAYAYSTRTNYAYANNKKSQSMYAWGQGIKGQLGIGFVQFGASAPTIVDSLANQDIAQVTSKSDITAAINKHGELYTWGSVRNGSMLTADGQTYSRNLDEPTIFASSEHTFKQCAVGKDHCAMLTDKGQVMTMGSIDHGKLGHEPATKE